LVGRYRLTSSAPERVPSTCARSGHQTLTSRRFEVVVRDNDMDRVPSAGDYFQITLPSATAVTSVLDSASVFYTWAGVLSSGNLTVD
jgi:hypothetical protein